MVVEARTRHLGEVRPQGAEIGLRRRIETQDDQPRDRQVGEVEPLAEPGFQKLLGFRLRDVTQQNLARYTNQPGKPNQTGLDLFAYHAYGWAPSAVAKLKTPAS